jgi:hypothetical protein
MRKSPQPTLEGIRLVNLLRTATISQECLLILTNMYAIAITAKDQQFHKTKL